VSTDKGRWAERRAQLMDALRRLGQGRDRPSGSGRAYTAADHDIGDTDPEAPPEHVPGIGDLPRYGPGSRTLRRSDGSEYTTDDPNVGPN
jgi:hypothetical protein